MLAEGILEIILKIKRLHILIQIKIFKEPKRLQKGEKYNGR